MDTSADAYFPDPRPLPPGQRRQLWARLAIRLGIFLSLVLFLCLAGRPLLSLCMPFALALLATWLTEPLLRFFHRRWNIPRGIGAIVLILLLVGALGGLMAALIWKGWSELSTLWGNWDQGWNAFQETYYQLSHALDKWLAYLPQQVQDTLWNLSDRLLAWLEEFVYNLLPKTTSAVRSISSFVLAFLFFLVAWYFTAEDYPNLRRVARETIPRSVRRIGVQARGAFSAAFGGYLKAEILVSLGVTGILLVGFFLLRQPYWVLLAVALGILDFIPIVGAGTVMVPWSVILLVLGEWKRGVAFLAGPDRAAPPALPAGHLRGHEAGGRGGDDPGPGSAADAPEPVAGGDVPRHRPGPHHGGPGYGGHPPWQTGGDRPARARKTRRNRSKNGERKLKVFLLRFHEIFINIRYTDHSKKSTGSSLGRGLCILRKQDGLEAYLWTTTATTTAIRTAAILTIPLLREMAPPFKAPAFRGQTLTGEVPGGKSPESP